MSKQNKIATVIAYGNRRYGYFDLFLSSCYRHGIDPIILGWGQPWIGSGKKLTDIRDYIVSLPANEIVISVDPFDVVFLSGLEEIIEKYQFARTEFICGAVKLKGLMKSVYEIEFNRSGIVTPEASTGYNYLNAGTWISRAGYAARLITEFENNYGIKPSDIDQQILTELFLRKQCSLDIDSECNLFQNIIFKNFISRVPDLKDIGFNHNRISNLANGTYPSILHVSGNTHMENIAIQLGYCGDIINPIKSTQLFARKAFFYSRKLLKYTIF